MEVGYCSPLPPCHTSGTRYIRHMNLRFIMASISRNMLFIGLSFLLIACAHYKNIELKNPIKKYSELLLLDAFQLDRLSPSVIRSLSGQPLTPPQWNRVLSRVASIDPAKSYSQKVQALKRGGCVVASHPSGPVLLDIHSKSLKFDGQKICLSTSGSENKECSIYGQLPSVTEARTVLCEGHNGRFFEIHPQAINTLKRNDPRIPKACLLEARAILSFTKCLDNSTI